MQFGHNDLCGRAPLFVVRMYSGGNAAAVVGDADRVVGMYRYRDVVAITGQSLVDGIVHDFEHHVMQAGAIGGVADVHAGTLAHRIQTLEHLDAAFFVVAIADMLRTCFVVHSRSSLNLRCKLVESSSACARSLSNTCQMRIGMTTYLKLSSPGTVNRALEFASPKAHSTSPQSRLF